MKGASGYHRPAAVDEDDVYGRIVTTLKITRIIQHKQQHIHISSWILHTKHYYIIIMHHPFLRNQYCMLVTENSKQKEGYVKISIRTVFADRFSVQANQL